MMTMTTIALATLVTGGLPWYTDSEVDPLTDERTYIAFKSADESTLYFRCKEGEPVNVIFAYKAGILQDHDSVAYRFDEEKPGKVAAGLSTNHQALFFSLPIKKFMESGRFVIQVGPYQERKRSFVFDLSGSAKALSEIATNCETEKQ